MKWFVPATDAFMVQRIRAAGAIILAKSNMAEWAFSPYETVSSIAGITRNPYNLGLCAGRFERRNRGRGGGKLRRGGFGHGYGKFDPRALVAQRLGRNSPDASD